MKVSLVSSANCGIGLWTSICAFFTNIFGIESKCVLKKQNLVLNKALDRLIENISKYQDVEDKTDFRVTWQSRFAVTLSITISSSGKKKIEQKQETQNNVNVEQPMSETIDYEKINEEGKYYFDEEHDYKKAFELFQIASAGSINAKYNLGYHCYYCGYGVEKDYDKAYELVKEAADAGFGLAKSALKKMKNNKLDKFSDKEIEKLKKELMNEIFNK